MRTKIEQFGDDYFYTLGLNNKFCDGITRFYSNKTHVALYNPEILGLITTWHEGNCSQAGYDRLAAELDKREKNRTMMAEYNDVWERMYFQKRFKQ